VAAEPVTAVETTLDVRCPSGDLYFKVIDGDRIEVKCGNIRCTGGDSVVLHRYSLTGDYLETLKFRNPSPRGRRARTPFRKEAP
jgi:hypothetical protein